MDSLLTFLKEIEESFHSNSIEDAELIEKIKHNIQKHEEKNTVLHQEVTDLLSTYHSTITALQETDITALEATLAAEESKKKNLQVDIAAIESNLQSEITRKKSAEQALVHQEEREDNLRLQETQIIRQRETLKQKQMFLSLYYTITSIHWNHSNKDKLRGDCIRNDQVFPFDYDLEKGSYFDIINHLWDIITRANHQ